MKYRLIALTPLLCAGIIAALEFSNPTTEALRALWKELAWRYRGSFRTLAVAAAMASASKPWKKPVLLLIGRASRYGVFVTLV